MRVYSLYLPILTMLLFSCQSQDHRPHIFQNGNLVHTSLPLNDTPIDPYVIRLNQELLINLIQLDVPFLMYVGNPSCSSCQSFRPILQQWVREEKPAIYYLDTLTLLFELPTIQTNFPNLFPTSFTTPSLYVIQGEERLWFAQSQSAFFQYNRFKPWIEAQIGIQNRLVFHQDQSIAVSLPLLIVNLDWTAVPFIFQDWLTVLPLEVPLWIRDMHHHGIHESLRAYVDEEALNEPSILYLSNPVKVIALATIPDPDNLRLWILENVL